MTPRHCINMMMVVFIFNNNINRIFHLVYEVVYGLFFSSSFLFKEQSFRGSSVG